MNGRTRRCTSIFMIRILGRGGVCMRLRANHSIRITLWSSLCGLMAFVLLPLHQLRIYLNYAEEFQPQGAEIINHYADTGEWHPAIWFLSAEHRKLVKSEIERIFRGFGIASRFLGSLAMLIEITRGTVDRSYCPSCLHMRKITRLLQSLQSDLFSVPTMPSLGRHLY